MSRKTSPQHDNLSRQDGYSGGKQGEFNPDEPDFSFDYDAAAAKVTALRKEGYRRQRELMAGGGQFARGSSANKYGFATAKYFTGFPSLSITPGDPLKYAVILYPQGNGIEVYQVGMISADAFQFASRGGPSGLTDDGDGGKSGGGYAFIEDRRNPEYSIAMYRLAGLLSPKEVVQAEKEGLVQRDMALPFFASDPKEAARMAKEETERRKLELELKIARQKAELEERRGNLEYEAERKRAEAELARLEDALRPIPAWELTVAGPLVTVAKDSAESTASKAHPGQQVAGLDFRSYSGGKAPGALGLPLPLLAYRKGEIVPATEELGLMQRKAQQGDKVGIQVLTDLGLWAPPPPRSPFDILGGLLGGL